VARESILNANYLKSLPAYFDIPFDMPPCTSQVGEQLKAGARH
jgi:hypothetical protein